MDKSIGTHVVGVYGGHTMTDLYETASIFRAAIQEAIKCGDITDINMRNFPSGACGYASELLQRYLWEKGVYTLYISGQYGHGWRAQNHAWLETRDRIVIDITGDQFSNRDPCFSIPVYVGPRKNGFHDMFVTDKPVVYHKNDDPLSSNRKSEERYNAILRHLK